MSPHFSRFSPSSSPSRKDALGGIVTALNLLMLAAAVMAPTGRAGFYFLTMLLPLLLLGEGMRGTAILSFLSASVLGFLLIPNRVALLPYVCLLGWYAIARDALSTRPPMVRRIVLLLCTDVGLLVRALLVHLLTGTSILVSLNLPRWAVIAGVIAFQPLYFVLDWFFGQCVSYYMEHIRPRLMGRK